MDEFSLTLGPLDLVSHRLRALCLGVVLSTLLLPSMSLANPSHGLVGLLKTCGIRAGEGVTVNEGAVSFKLGSASESALQESIDAGANLVRRAWENSIATRDDSNPMLISFPSGTGLEVLSEASKLDILTHGSKRLSDLPNAKRAKDAPRDPRVTLAMEAIEKSSDMYHQALSINFENAIRFDLSYELTNTWQGVTLEKPFVIAKFSHNSRLGSIEVPLFQSRGVGDPENTALLREKFTAFQQGLESIHHRVLELSNVPTR